MEIPGPGRAAATANFSESPGPAGRVGKRAVLGHLHQVASRTPGSPAARVLPSAAATRLGDLGTTRLLLDPDAKPDAGTWQVARVERACLLYGTHRSKEGEIVRFGREGKVQSSDPCSPSPQSGSQGQRRRLLY